MKTLLFMLGCFYLIICSYVQAIDWDKCGSGKQILQLWRLKISPDPIRLSGKDALVSFQADLYEDIPAGSRIQVNVWKVTWFGIYMKAPCFLSTGCDVELCSFLEYFSGERMCPVTAGLYESNDIEFDIPDLSSFEQWFASGRFWIELKVTGPNSEQLTCWSFKGYAKQLFSQWKPDLLTYEIGNEISVMGNEISV